MTQDEAKEKFCPFVRPEYLAGKPFTGRPLCIASACMAWRWRDYPKRDHGYCGMAERT